MSENHIIQELIDMVVLDKKLKEELDGIFTGKKRAKEIIETRRILESTRVRFLEILNNGDK
jgi:hypothetical protein